MTEQVTSEKVAARRARDILSVAALLAAVAAYSWLMLAVVEWLT